MFSDFSYTKLKVCMRMRTKSSVPIRLSPALVGLPNAKSESVIVFDSNVVSPWVIEIS